MNYIELIKNFWTSHNAHSFSTTEIALYFYLVEVFNICQWKNQIKRNNRKVEADLDISFNTLKNARNKLHQAELIFFKSTNGNANVAYSLSKFDEVDYKVGTKVSAEVGTRSVPSKDKLNKTKHSLYLNGQEKFLSEFLFKSYEEFISNVVHKEILCMNNSLPMEHLEDLIKTFYVELQNRGEEYKTIQDAKNHFSNWLAIEREKEKQSKQRGGGNANNKTTSSKKADYSEAM